MTDLSRLPASIQKLQSFSWAPNPTTMYTTKSGHGLGLIASRSYGAFNVAWALCGQEKLIGGDKPAHLHAVKVFALQECANKQVIQGAELGDWLTLHGPAEFARWFRGNKKKMEPAVRARLQGALFQLRVLNA